MQEVRELTGKYSHAPQQKEVHEMNNSNKKNEKSYISKNKRKRRHNKAHDQSNPERTENKSRPKELLGEPLLTTQQVADYMGKKKKTLENWRYKNLGPEYIKLVNGSLRYEPRTIRKYVKNDRGGGDNNA